MSPETLAQLLTAADSLAERYELRRDAVGVRGVIQDDTTVLKIAPVSPAWRPPLGLPAIWQGFAVLVVRPTPRNGGSSTHTPS
jgi:hypothetical protein